MQEPIVEPAELTRLPVWESGYFVTLCLNQGSTVQVDACFDMESFSDNIAVHLRHDSDLTGSWTED